MFGSSPGTYGAGVEGCFAQNGQTVPFLSAEGGIDDKNATKRTMSSDLYYGAITAYDAINQFAGSANSTYSGATVTLNRQFTDDFQVLAGYTYSKTIDDGSFDLEQPPNPAGC